MKNYSFFSLAIAALTLSACGHTITAPDAANQKYVEFMVEGYPIQTAYHGGMIKSTKTNTAAQTEKKSDSIVSKSASPVAGTVKEMPPLPLNKNEKNNGVSLIGSSSLEEIHFAFNSKNLDDKNQSVLLRDIEVLKQNPNMKIKIVGHSDIKGGKKYNLALSEQRALAVQTFLEKNGISGNRLSVAALGKKNPLTSEKSDAAQAKNRRADFIVIKPE